MFSEEAKSPKRSLIKIKKVCHVLNIAFWIVFAIFCIFWMSAVAVLTYSVVQNSDANFLSYYQVLLCLVYGLIIALMFIVFMRFFSDVAHGDSPFTMTQVKRLRMLSGLILGYFVLDTLILNSSILLNVGVVDSGYVATNGNPITSVYFAPLIAAAVVFAFSFVFKYGVLLQEFSDETL